MSVEAAITWPAHVGVGGLSLRGSQDRPLSRSPVRARTALGRWLHAGPPRGGHPRTDEFPFREIVAHYQTVGRTDAAPELVEQLRDLHLRLPVPRTADEWHLAHWLPSTFDQPYGDYDSYLATMMMERIAEVGPVRGTDRAFDILVVVLLADLLLTEAGALAANLASKRQRSRTKAILHVLTRAHDLAPAAPDTGLDVTAVSAQLSDDPDGPELAVLAQGCARAVLSRLPATARTAAQVSMLPTTRLHDEHMFIRSVQTFELIYRQVYRCLLRAIGALQVDDHLIACAQLAAATGRLEATSVLFRLLTTMPREAFAIIRSYTDGRSALQSRAYRQVEWVCAARPQDTGGKIPYVHVPAPTLQEVYLARVDLLPEGPARQVTDALLRLDTSWRAMKRTHWGITLKIIGTVPGTGGTSGADYLKTTSEMPLFPLLQERVPA